MCFKKYILVYYAFLKEDQNSLSINKKNHIYIKCSLLNKTLHSVKSEIFSIQLWRKLTKFYPMTIISSDQDNGIKFFRNYLPCPRMLKMIRRNKWFNPSGESRHFSLVLHTYIDRHTDPQTKWVLEELLS